VFPSHLSRVGRDWRTRALSVAVVVAVAVTLTPPVAHSEALPVDRFLVADREAIMALPTSGSAWRSVVDNAAKPLVPDLSDQNSMSASYAVAAGLVHVRTGDTAMRDKVVAALRVLPGTELRSPNILSVGRQMAGWIIAADLVGYRDPVFASWVSELRTKNIGGHGRWYAITRTHENSASWGTSSGMSRIAMSAYLGDTADVARAALLLRAYTGEDHEAWPGLPAKQNAGGFERTGAFDESWAGKLDHWVPINGYRNTKPELDGALIESISRSQTSYPEAPDHTGLAYSWELMAGLVMQAQLLSRQGYPDVWSWGDDALRRATDYLHRAGGFSDKNLTSPGRFVPWLIDAAYGTAYADRPAGNGRAFGYTDWLAPTLTNNNTTTQPEPSTAVSQ
jgi:hypothetical protein